MAVIRQGRILSTISRIPIPAVLAVPFSLSIPLWISIYSTIESYNDYVRSETWRLQKPFPIEEFDFIVGKVALSFLIFLSLLVWLVLLRSCTSWWRIRWGCGCKSAFEAVFSSSVGTWGRPEPTLLPSLSLSLTPEMPGYRHSVRH